MNFLVFLVIFVHNIILSRGENQEVTSEEGYNDYGNGKASNFLSFYQREINNRAVITGEAGEAGEVGETGEARGAAAPPIILRSWYF